jgi:phosphopantothenate-cysteine ligase
VDARGLYRLVQGRRSTIRILSTQLETEDSLLIPKARAALSRYGHQIVIGNDLHRRKYEVVFVERTSGQRATSTNDSKGVETPPLQVEPTSEGAEDVHEGYKETWLRLEDIQSKDVGAAGELEIESLIVEELVKRHTDWVDAATG